MPKVLYTGTEEKNIGRFGLVLPGQVLDFTDKEAPFAKDNPQYKILDAAEASVAEKRFREAQAAKAGISRAPVAGGKDAANNKKLPPGQTAKKVVLTDADLAVLKEQLDAKTKEELDAIVDLLTQDGHKIEVAADADDAAKRAAILAHYETLKA